MKLIFIDTETTGLEKEDRIVSVGWSIDQKIAELTVKPPVPIGLEAMATHHITNEYVKELKGFKEYKNVYNGLKEQIENNILVAHNAPFDIEMLKREGINPVRYIDTLRVAQHLIEDLDSYKLQVLRYYFKIDIEAEAHTVIGDVHVLEKVFQELGRLYISLNVKSVENVEKSRSDTINSMIELSKKPVILKKFLFGKHKGKTFEEVAQKWKGYLIWLRNSEMAKPEEERNENILATLAKYV